MIINTDEEQNSKISNNLIGELSSKTVSESPKSTIYELNPNFLTAAERKKCMEELEAIREENKKNQYKSDPNNPDNNLTVRYGEIKDISSKDYIVICYFCNEHIKINPEWKMFECGHCHRMNRIPQNLINQIYFANKLKNIRYSRYNNHLDMILPLPFIAINCPNCKAENKVESVATHFICFICGHSFNINHNQKKIQKYEKCSLNPNSEYYRYKDYEFKPVYTPPNKVMRIPERFFPDPIAYSNNQIGSKLFLNDFRWNLDNHTLCYMNGIGNTINMN